MLNGGLGIESVDDAAEGMAGTETRQRILPPQFRQGMDKNLTSIHHSTGNKFQVVWKQYAAPELS
jgi:hypothetical protein